VGEHRSNVTNNATNNDAIMTTTTTNKTTSSEKRGLEILAKMTAQEHQSLLSTFPPVFFISALKEDGTDDVLHHLVQCAQTVSSSSSFPNIDMEDEEDSQNDNYYHNNDNDINMNPTSEIERISEIIREKLYRSLHREVPHQISQLNRSIRRVASSTNNTIVIIDQIIIVHSKSHARLVNGKGGLTLRRIMEDAKRDILKGNVLDNDNNHNNNNGRIIENVVLNLSVRLEGKKSSKGGGRGGRGGGELLGGKGGNYGIGRREI